MSHSITTSPLSSGDSFPLSFINKATKETRSETVRVDIKTAGCGLRGQRCKSGCHSVDQGGDDGSAQCVVVGEKEVVQAPDRKPSEKVQERVHLVSLFRGLPPSPSATAKLTDCTGVGIGEVGASPSTRCAANTWDPITVTKEGTLIRANNSDRRRRGGREGARSSWRRRGSSIVTEAGRELVVLNKQRPDPTTLRLDPVVKGSLPSCSHHVPSPPVADDAAVDGER
uniref:Uncharacterized protein n=1 Tax=Oryza barthii TaxID=65489 RepID=A0A0D3F5R3_9ORYZ